MADEPYNDIPPAASELEGLSFLDRWLSLEDAPYNRAVIIKAGHMEFEAILRPGISMSSDGEPCDQWEAAHEGEHPPCWSGGACWEINESECASLQPTAWKEIPTQFAASNATLRAENERLRVAGFSVLQHYEHEFRDGNAPGHCHAVPGIWDDGNEPDIAGTACQWCSDWTEFRAALAAQQKEVG